LGVTLISIARITQAGFSLHFRQQECRILDARDRRIGAIPLVHGLYQVRVEIPTPRANVADGQPLVVTPDQLHILMGHIPVDAAKKLVKNQLVEGLELDETQPISTDECKSCLHGRMTRKPISKGTERQAAGEMGDEIHTDVWGPAPVETTQHKKYYVSFTDE
ncbi:hypothetical protein C8R44DRAFT_578804, partial [Mycena epipterygia]